MALEQRELHPTGTSSGIFTAQAYVNPGSEAVSVIGVKILLCRDFVQRKNDKHTLFRHFVIVIYCKYTETCQME